MRSQHLLFQKKKNIMRSQHQIAAAGMLKASTNRKANNFYMQGRQNEVRKLCLLNTDSGVNFRKYNHLHNAQFPRLSPHRDLDLPTQTCSPAPVCSLMHMALAGLLAKCQCICSLRGACAC